MYYIENTCTDPHFNLALEQYVFDRLSGREDFFILWQNANSIIIGKHQNTMEEINAAFVKEHDIQVVRRLSGGGAVYHDLGNVNFTFISRHEGEGFDFSTFCRPVLKALKSLGVDGELSGRNDMTIEGRKFSGNSQYVKQGRVMHHGTIMYDSDLEMVSKSLKVPEDKFQSKGLKSVRARVTNVKPHLSKPVSTKEFMDCLRSFMFEEYDIVPYHLTEEDMAEIGELQREVYEKWDWNYGESPACRVRKRRRVEGVGQIEVWMDIENGIIQKMEFYGDYFGNRDASELSDLFTGARLLEEEIMERLGRIEIQEYISNISPEGFCSILLQ
ncbi:MAG: lipoate--protein ligase [Clostridium sp.]|nr:lipoate--protein ligase [Clostridium sp.]